MAQRGGHGTRPDPARRPPVRRAVCTQVPRDGAGTARSLRAKAGLGRVSPTASSSQPATPRPGIREPRRRECPRSGPPRPRCGSRWPELAAPARVLAGLGTGGPSCAGHVQAARDHRSLSGSKTGWTAEPPALGLAPSPQGHHGPLGTALSAEAPTREQPCPVLGSVKSPGPTHLSSAVWHRVQRADHDP